MLNFDQLEISEQVEFLNKQLADNPNTSLTKLLKKLGLNKSTIYKRFTVAGYKYSIDEKKYINKISKTISTQNYINKNSDSEELFKYKDILIKIAKEYQNDNIDKSNKMIIDTSLVVNKTVNHNFNVYDCVKKEIQDLQKQYPHFKLTDLVSTALHEFFLKYNKQFVK